jgi:predicted anti-sigma-YlaC factor YlaD
MNCKDIGGHLLDMAAGAAVPPEVEEHLRDCTVCATQWKSLTETMSLLDGWDTPEPSPYFNTRLRARLREQPAAQPWWQAWLRKPALAVAMGVLMAVGAGLYFGAEHRDLTVQQQPAPIAEPGSAVNDLINLDKNHDILANFDALDEFGGQDPDSQNMNP